MRKIISVKNKNIHYEAVQNNIIKSQIHSMYKIC